MPNQTLQLFNPLAIHGLAIHLKDFDYRRFTLPHYLSSEDKQRLIALLLGALRAHSSAEGKDANEPLGSLIKLRWEDRAWRNAAQAPAIKFNHNDVLWLIVEKAVPEAELLAFIDDCDCLTLLDLRYSGKSEHVEWLAKLKMALLDATQQWWRNHVKQAEADKVDFRDSGEWFESPLDALDYCNAIAAGLFGGHSLIYVERQAMAAILAGKALSLTRQSVIALVGFALRERWERLRFQEPRPLPDFAPHYANWQAAGLGWLAGNEFVPLPAVERLQEGEQLELFFARWNRDSEEDAAIFLFWDVLRPVLTPPDTLASDPQMRGLGMPFRPSESLIRGGTCGTPKDIRQKIATLFSKLPLESDDPTLQEAISKETNDNCRVLLLAWRASLWLDVAGDHSISAKARLRAENDVVRSIDRIWSRLYPTPISGEPAIAAAESWARLRVALADHLTERARVGQMGKMLALAKEHYSQSLTLFRQLNNRPREASVLKAMGNILIRINDLVAARASYEKALTIFREIEDRRGEANVLGAVGDLLIRVGDLTGAQSSYEKALTVFREVEDRRGEASVLRAMGSLLMREDDLEGARANYKMALTIFREIEDRLGEVNVLGAIGDLLMRVGDLTGARASYEKALTVFREVEERRGEASVLRAMGNLLIREGDLTGARASYEKALTIFREIEDQRGEADLLGMIGDLLMRAGDLTGAQASYEKALTVFREVEDQRGEANVLRAMGNLLMREGGLVEARASYEKALTIFREIKDQRGEANLLARIKELTLAEDNWLDADHK
jgi:predicted negative regulator of RcsB-dependent stress response